MKAFLYYFSDESNPTKPVWYAGLGVPYKFTSDFSFAKSVSFQTPSTSLLMKHLEKYTGKSFYQITLNDAMPSQRTTCECCGVGWTIEEVEACEDATQIHFTHLASPLRTEAASSFTQKIMNARWCRNDSCQAFLCGDCVPSPRSRTCPLCKPSRRLV